MPTPKLQKQKGQVSQFMPSNNSARRPKLSIVIPSHNRGHDMVQVLIDLERQTMPPFEIVITDDKSDPKELKIITDHLRTSKNSIRFYKNKSALRLAGNANEAVSRAKGEYVTIVNNDDRLSPRYVECICDAIIKHPGYNVYTTNAVGMTQEKKMVGDYRLYRKTQVIPKTTGIRHLWQWYFMNLITVSGATIYKTTYKKSHPFDTKLDNEADLNLAMMMLATEDIYYIDVPIYFVRMHDDQTSRKIRRTHEKLVDNITRCLSIYKRYPSHKKNVFLYLEKIKGVHILQLRYKYRYSFEEIQTILDIRTKSEFVISAATTLWFVFAFYLRVFTFRLRKSQYKCYAPPDIQ